MLKLRCAAAAHHTHILNSTCLLHLLFQNISYPMSLDTGEGGALSEQEKQELFQDLLSGYEYVYLPVSLSLYL